MVFQKKATCFFFRFAMKGNFHENNFSTKLRAATGPRIQTCLLFVSAHAGLTCTCFKQNMCRSFLRHGEQLNRLEPAVWHELLLDL